MTRIEVQPVGRDRPAAAKCSTVAQSLGVSPIGTAGAYDCFVLVEHPMPWASEVTDDPLLAKVRDVARRTLGSTHRVRIQAIAAGTVADMRSVILYRRQPGTFRCYERTELTAAPGDIPAAVEALASAAVGAATTDRGAAVTDLLICTHGARDRCCGASGTRLWQAIGRPVDVRVWRTSHTGGHRFAPTAITFPAGQFWAFLDPDTLHGLLTQSMTPDQLRGSYRGCAGFDSPEAQAAEAELFFTRGWDWLEQHRQVTPVPNSPGLFLVGHEDCDGTVRADHVEVRRRRMVPTPPCGIPAEAPIRKEPEWSARLIEHGQSPPSVR